MGGSRGEQGVQILPLKNHMNLWFDSNTIPDPLKTTKLLSQPLSARQRLAGGPMLARLMVLGSSLPSST